MVTFDLEIVHSRAPENLKRLIAALADLDAIYRFPAERRLRPNETHVSGPGHVLLATRFGPLDVLGAIGNGRTYDELLPHATVEEVAPDLRFRVVDLETIIVTKEEAGRDEDAAALPTVRATLAEVRRSPFGPHTTS